MKEKFKFVRYCKAEVCELCISPFVAETRRTQACPFCTAHLHRLKWGVRDYIKWRNNMTNGRLYTEKVEWKEDGKALLETQNVIAMQNAKNEVVGKKTESMVVEARRVDLEANLLELRRKEKQVGIQLAEKKQKVDEKRPTLTAAQQRLINDLQAVQKYQTWKEVQPEIDDLTLQLAETRSIINERLKTLSKAPQRDYEALSNEELHACLGLYGVDVLEVTDETRADTIIKIKALEGTVGVQSDEDNTN